ncbi:MAG: hypothetical protein D6732_03660 [Methanobacteriota archaeon]|nr:MAG: hypothetical protein D6732_03660 [Euryarchaeota archaeon]
MFAKPVQEPIQTDYLIMGAGVSGLTLGKILAANGKDVYILGSPYDSQIAKAGIIEDSKRIAKDTKGMKWIENALKEAKAAGAKHRSSKAIAVKEEGEYLLVKTKMVDFHAKFLIIATGAHQQSFGFKGEKEFFHKGVSDCAVCDANLFRGRHAAIVGNHKYTLKSARYIANIVKKVNVLWLEHDLPEQNPHFQALMKLDNVEIFNSVQDIEIYGSDVVEGVKFMQGEVEKNLDVQVVFIEGEPQPSTELFRDLLKLDPTGHVEVNEYQTSHPQIFALGDVIKGEKSLDRALEDAERLGKILNLA